MLVVESQISGLQLVYKCYVCVRWCGVMVCNIKVVMHCLENMLECLSFAWCPSTIHKHATTTCCVHIDAKNIVTKQGKLQQSVHVEIEVCVMYWYSRFIHWKSKSLNKSTPTLHRIWWHDTCNTCTKHCTRWRKGMYIANVFDHARQGVVRLTKLVVCFWCGPQVCKFHTMRTTLQHSWWHAPYIQRQTTSSYTNWSFQKCSVPVTVIRLKNIMSAA
jgi:hypothetical protein